MLLEIVVERDSEMFFLSYFLLTVLEVKTWAASLRAQLGKLIKPKPSHSGYKPPTSKQQWILKHLEFLRPHMIYKATVTTVNVFNSKRFTKRIVPLMLFKEINCELLRQ